MKLQIIISNPFNHCSIINIVQTSGLNSKSVLYILKKNLFDKCSLIITNSFNKLANEVYIYQNQRGDKNCNFQVSHLHILHA